MALDANDLAEINKNIRSALSGVLRSIFDDKGGVRGRVGGGSISRDEKALKKSQEDQRRSLDKTSEKLKTFSDKTVASNEALRTFSTRILTVDTIIKQLNGNLIELKKNIGKSKPQVVEFDFSKLTSGTDTLVNSFATLNSSISPLSTKFNDLDTSLKDISDKVDTFGNALTNNTPNVGTSFTVNPITIPDSAITVNPITIPGTAITVSPIAIAGLDFGSLNTAFDDLRKKISDVVTPTITKFREQIGIAHDSLLLINQALATTIGTLSIPTTGAAFTNLNATMTKVNPGMVTFKGNVISASKALRDFKKGLGSGGDSRSSDTPYVDDATADAAKKKKADEDKSEKIKGNIKKYAYELFGAFKELVDDAYQVLAARGYGTTDSMYELYKDAALAGMSLREYAQFMDKNMIAVSRASSFADFQKDLKTSTDALKQFGVFGQDAVNMAGTMKSAAVGMGVPQQNLNAAVKAQTEAFAELRKGSNLTADAFQQLISQIQDDVQIRTELSALNTDEKIARQKDLLLQLGYAKSLNLSESAQRAYTQSVLEQRKSTVKQRFEQAGRISQVGAMVGMSAEDTERMRVLSKNKYKTDAEQREFQDLAGKLNTGLEKMQQGGAGSQFQSDVARGLLDQAGLGSTLEAAAAIKAGKEAGPTENKDLNKTLKAFEQGIGTVVTTLSGLMKNPLAELVTMAGAQLASSITSNVLLGIIAKNGVGGGLGGFRSTLGKVGKFAGIAGAVASVGMAAWDIKKAYDLDPEKEGTKEAKGNAVGGGIGSIAGGAIGAALGSLIAPGVGTAIGATIGSGFGQWAGGLVGAMLSAETAQEKNTRELNAFRKEYIKSRKELAGADTIDVSQIGSLGLIARKTAKAYIEPSDAEIKQKFEEQKSPERKAEDLAAAQKEYDRLMTISTGFANGGKRVWQIEGKAEPVDPRISKSSELITDVATTPTTTTTTAPAKTDDQGYVPEKYKSLKDAGWSDFFTKVNGATIPQNQQPSSAAAPVVSSPTMAIPASTTTSAIGPNKNDQKANINKTAEEEVKPKEKTETTLQQNPIADASQILLQILEVLKNSLTAETLQAQLTEQLIRANALRPTLPDNQDLARRLYAQV